MNERDVISGAGGSGFATLRRLADGIALAAGYLAAFCLAVLVALVTGEIVMALLSKMFRSLPPGISIAWEYSSYLMGISFMLGSGLTLRAGMHVRVELLLRAGDGRYVRQFEILSALVGSLFTGLLSWSLARFTLQSWNSGQVSGDSLTPLWIPQAALTIGAAVLFLQMVLRFFAGVLNEPLEDKSLGAATLPE
ncbi:FcbT2 TRAP-type mannitol/chloroaromatic compound transport system, small permease component [Rhabdaerophilaceae bacterium]